MPLIFNKLKGRSIDEFLTRVRQSALRLYERTGITRFDDPLSFGLLKPTSDERLLAPWIEHQHEFPTYLKKTFSNELEGCIEEAEGIIEGKFKLLGLEDLYFDGTIPNWHFDPVSGKTSPRVHWTRINEINAEVTGDKKVIWELNRHQYFVVLGLAYSVTSDERYADTFVRHLKSWLVENPPKIGVNWLSSLELAFRSISWIHAYYLFKDSPHLDRLVLENIIRSLTLSARHIENYLSTYFSPNTHLTGEALGLYYVGTFLPDFRRSQRWRAIGCRILEDALDFQIREDGVYCEQSSHYTRYTADFYLDFLSIRLREGLPLELRYLRKIELLCDFLMQLTTPDGMTPLFGDEDGGRYSPLDRNDLGDFTSTSAVAALDFGRSDFKFVARDAPLSLAWSRGLTGVNEFRKIRATEPKVKAKGFMEGGFYVLRDNWQPHSRYLLIDCGPHGFKNGGHAHADALGFVMDFDGRPVFIDSGTFCYTADLAARNRFRSTSAHNCLIVNDTSSSVPDGPFSWKTVANAHLIEWHEDTDAIRFCGTHDGYSRFGVEYQRSFALHRNGPIEIIDTIRSSRQNEYGIVFILAPDVVPEFEDSTVHFKSRLSQKWQMKLQLTVETIVHGTISGWRIEDWEVSPSYGSVVKTHRIVFGINTERDFQTRIEIT